MNVKLELDQLLQVLAEKGFQPLGLIFYDPKHQLLGLASLEEVPEAWVQLIGERLGGIKGSGSWIGLHQA